MKFIISIIYFLFTFPLYAEQRFFVNIVSIDDDDKAEYLALQRESSRFWDKHGIAVLGRMEVIDTGILVGGEPLPMPDYIEIFRIESWDQFDAYVSDPDYMPLNAARSELISAVQTMHGPISPNGGALNAPIGSSYAVVSFSSLAQGGRESLDRFDAVADGLLDKYRIHTMIDISIEQVDSRIGPSTLLYESIDAVTVYSTPSMEAYAATLSDIAYESFAETRFEGVIANFYFIGRMIN